jgi:hypothetical protein
MTTVGLRTCPREPPKLYKSHHTLAHWLYLFREPGTVVRYYFPIIVCVGRRIPDGSVQCTNMGVVV